MICCVIAAAFIVKYVIGFGKIAALFGFAPRPKEDVYGYTKYCELDDYES